MSRVVCLSYNIQFGKSSQYEINRIGQVIKESGAEIVALQEVDRFLSRSGAIDQVQQLSTLTNLPHTLFRMTVPHPGAPDCSEEAQFGIAILSKYPILDSRVCEYQYTIPGNEPRIALAVLLELPARGSERGEQFWFINTHIGLDFRYREQAQQSEELVRFLEEQNLSTHPRVIICGDFNSFNMVCRSIQTMKTSYKDAWEVYHERAALPDSNLQSKGFGATFPAIFPLVRIDYFWLSPKFVADLSHMDVEVLSTTASDHRPLRLLLEWN